MSLLSTDINQVKRLSLKGVSLPTPESKEDPITPLHVERPLTDEDIDFIDKNIKQWLSTIKNNNQLIGLIRVRYIEQKFKKWDERLEKYTLKEIYKYR